MKLKCKQCGAEVHRKPSEIKRNGGNVFCNRSCSASYNNKIHPKRKLEGECFKCKALIKSGWKYCKDCSPETVRGDLTLDEAIYKKHELSSAFALVRSRARAKTKNRPQVCEHCSYSKHVETCHIKPISEFSGDTLLSEINSDDNLILLCPNHHWELDHGLLSLEEIMGL